MIISEIRNDAPEKMTTDTQAMIYNGLAECGAEWSRVDNEPAISVDDCEELSRVLGAPTVKTLLIANRQLTKYYLVVMPGHKPFITKDFTKALGVSRVSFVKPELLMEMLGLEVGACTPLAIIADKGENIRMVIDREVAERDNMLIPDGTTTCYMNLSTEDLINKFLPYTDHSFEITDL